ncbi:MAG: hypothetical protein IT429_16220, partial [Gemmataceae bacterium]|nr:hypothetical protein [Gemmataceae bacterium]
LSDAKKVKHKVCLDGRVEAGKVPRGGLFPLVLGATYPTDKGARRVDFRSPEEAALYGVMLRWARAHPKRDALLDPSKELNDAQNPNLWEVREFLQCLEQRFIQYAERKK